MLSPVPPQAADKKGRSVGNRVRLLHDGEQAFPAMLAAIGCAQREVLLEMYWFASDPTGLHFAQALMERARAGVTVRVIYDAIGSFEAEDAMFDEMREAGCEIFEYHPIAPWRARFSFAGLNRRNHRKLLVVDGDRAITGGINLGDPWAPVDQGGDAFRDDAIEVVGPAARELRMLFYRTFPEAPVALLHPPPSGGDCQVNVLASDLRRERRGIRQGYLRAISGSHRDIIITNSYFIPDRLVRKALARAVARGVRVRVLMPRDSDVLLVQYAARALYGRLLKAGVELYEWSHGVLHSKTAVIDDWCTVGSYNFDYRSFRLNLELNLAVRSANVAGDLRERVEQDLALSARVDPERWHKRGWLVRLVERTVYLFRWLL